MQVKKIVAIFLAAALMFSLVTASAVTENPESFMVGVEAETATPISSNPYIINQGEEISIRVNASQNTGISFLKFFIYYDPQAFDFLEKNSSNLFGTDSAQEKITVHSDTGNISYFMNLNSKNNSAISNATGNIFTFKLKAKNTYCGNVVIKAVLAGNRPANCSKYETASKNKYIPFEGGAVKFALHDIDIASGVATAPTCTEDGFTTYVCSACNESVKGNIVPATGHTPDVKVIENSVEPTCTENGSYDEVVYCKVCNAELDRNTVVLPASGHTPDVKVIENSVEPTCTEDGSYDEVVYCKVCNAELVRNTVILKALGHTPGEAVEENRIEASCTEDGSYDSVVYCTVCKAEITRKKVVIPATGHSASEAVEENRVEPTCTKDGSYDTVVYCSICKTELSRDTVKLQALGHKPNPVVIDKKVEPTCTTDGSYDEVVYCSVCGDELSRNTVVVPALGHTSNPVVIENNIEPTCTIDGSYDEVVYCSVCGDELSRNTVVVPALGHTSNPVVIENNIEPTCSEEGSYDLVVYCSVCGDELSRKTVNVAAKGHDYGEPTVVEPDYKVEGYTTHTCITCGHVEKYDITPAYDYMLGDTNADETVDSADAIHLLYNAFFPDDYKINQKSDFDGNGTTDSDDAIYLLYYTFFNEKYPLHR